MERLCKVSFICTEKSARSVLSMVLGEAQKVVITSIPDCEPGGGTGTKPAVVGNGEAIVSAAQIPHIMSRRSSQLVMIILKRTPDKARSLSEINHELEQEGYTRGSASGVLSELVQQGIVRRPSRGYYMPAR